MGTPMITEEGVAGEVITPGYLVEGQATVNKSTIDGLKAPIRVALERDELGKGIDDTRGSETADYAVGDTVKVGHFHMGQRFLGFIASGQDITADDLLEAAGDGTFEALAGAEPLVRAVESVDATGYEESDVRIRLEVI
jgi:hypothetical protein